MYARSVAIFTDEPGWHGRSLRKELANCGYTAQFVTLRACALDLSAAQPRIVIPELDNLPAGAFVRGIAGGTLEEVVARLDVLHALEILGVPVFNTGRAIERTVDKGLTSFLLAHHRIPTPRTWVIESAAQARSIVESELAAGRSVVMKPLFGSQGNGVMRISSLSEFADAQPVAGVFYLQEYVNAGEREFRDWRVFVIDGRAVAVMQRRSTHWVTNRAQGAICEAVGADARLFALAEAAAAAVGVDYAGVDLLRDRNGQWLVSEVNGIPAWQGLQRAVKRNITRQLVDAFIGKIERTRAVAATA